MTGRRSVNGDVSPEVMRRRMKLNPLALHGGYTQQELAVRRERAFIRLSTTRSVRRSPLSRTSNHPHFRFDAGNASQSAAIASCETRVSA